MAENEHFLKLYWRFSNFVDEFQKVALSPERDTWSDNFFKGVWRFGHCKGEEVMIRSRAYQACVYITLYDEECADSEGLSQAYEDLRRDWSTKYFDPVRGGWVLRPYNLGQCERTNGPSHVEDGGGDALEPAPFCCEKPLGPSRYTGDATKRGSQDKDRSSPAQSLETRAELDRHNVDTNSEGFP
jgi:hypothetical protein